MGKINPTANPSLAAQQPPDIASDSDGVAPQAEPTLDAWESAQRLRCLETSTRLPRIDTELKLEPQVRRTIADLLSQAGVKQDVRLWYSSKSGRDGMWVRCALSDGTTVHQAKGVGMNANQAALSAVRALITDMAGRGSNAGPRTCDIPKSGTTRPSVDTDIKINPVVQRTILDKIDAAGLSGPVRIWYSSKSGDSVMWFRASVVHDGQVYEAKGPGLDVNSASLSVVDNLIKQIHGEEI